MIQKCLLFVLTIWLTLLNGSNLVATSAEHGKLDERVLFMEFALNNKSFDELGVAIENLQPDSFSGNQTFMSAISGRLLEIGLELYRQGEKSLAFSLFEKVQILDPREWRSISFLNQFRDDKKFIDFSNTKKQFIQVKRLLQNFEPAVILITQINEALFWAVLLTMLFFTIWLVRHYLSLATYDMILNEKGFVEKKRLVIWILLLLWPIFIGSGWFLMIMIVISSLWFYTDGTERKTLVFLFTLLALTMLVSSFNQFLLHQAENASFLQAKKIMSKHLMSYDADAVEKNPSAKLLLAFNNFHVGNLEDGMEWLNSTDDKLKHDLKKNLYGFAFLTNNDYQNAISVLSDVLSHNPTDQTALYNITLALLENKDEKTFDAFVNRFPRIATFSDIVGQPQLPVLSDGFLWSLFLSSGKSPDDMTLFYIIKSSLRMLIRIPIIYFFIILLLYIKFLPVLFHDIGKSTHCAKCQKAIKKENPNRAVNVCNDCYQLFLIKDAMMADAKTFKEADIHKTTRRKNMLLLVFSFLSPGFFLHMRGQHRLFATINFFYYFFLLIAFVVWHPLAQYYGTVPLFAKTFGVLAAIVFLVANSLIFQGDEYGI